MLGWQRAVQKMSRAPFRSSLEKMQVRHATPVPEATTAFMPMLVSCTAALSLSGSAFLAEAMNAKDPVDVEEVEEEDLGEPDFSSARYGGIYQPKPV